MKVLIVSNEPWREDNNAGNVTTNLFEGSGFQFANIYCAPGEPNNALCKKYYQMTDMMMIDNVFKHTTVGKERIYTKWPKDVCEKQDVKITSVQYKFFRKFNFSIFYLVRSIIWQLADWNNVFLSNFVKAFEPDLIYAPCYGSKEMLDIVVAVKKIANVPLVSYIWDDVFSLKQISLAPSFWIRRFQFRHTIKKNQSIIDLMYTMTEEQKVELEKELSIKLKVLKKNGNFDNAQAKSTINNPIRIIYAGNLIYGRYNTLRKVVKALEDINKNAIRAKLYIYTSDVLLKKHIKNLDDGRSCELKGRVSYDELKQIYKKMDVAIHVESFSLKYRYLTRLSFSTKIIDCLESGCAILAISWKGQSGYKYIKKNNIGLCVDNPNEIKKILEELVSDSRIIEKYSAKAIEFGKKNHDYKVNREKFWTEIKSLAEI